MLDTENPVAETVEVETPVAPPNIEEALEAIPEPTDALDAEVVTEAEEVVEDKPDETVEEAPEEAKTDEPVAEPVTFAPELETAELIEKGKAEVEKFDLPQPLQAYIEALEAKAQVPQFAEAEVYGDALPDLLERQYDLDKIEEVDGNLRPRTDLFIEKLADPIKRDWLYHDLASMPSQKYPGLLKFQESIADAIRIDGESTEKTLERYSDTITALRTGATIIPDTPAFVPANLQEAYARLPKETRDELAMLDMTEDYDKDIAVKQIANLELIQRGIDADKADVQRDVQARQYREQQLSQKIATTENTFWKTYKDGVIETLSAKVKFSDNPTTQKLQVLGNVANLAGIFSEDNSDTVKALQDAGIKFDTTTPQVFIKDVERASIALAHADSLRDAKGTLLDPIGYKKAENDFKAVSKRLIDFGENILDQQARLINTGKVEEIKEAVAKQKVELKARTVPKGTGTAAVKKESVPVRGTQAWKDHWANQAMEEAAQRAGAYRPA